MQQIIYWKQQGGYPRPPQLVYTPFRLYQADQSFKQDAINISRWIVRKLGYPILDVQVTDQLVYTFIQQSLLQFSSIINQQKASQSLLQFIGVSKDHLPQVVKTPILTNRNFIANLSQQYADMVGVGQKVKLFRGGFRTQPGKTTYSLQEQWMGKPADLGNKQIQIKRVYYVQNHDRRRQQFSLFMIPGLINSQASVAYMLWYPQGIMAPLQMLMYKQKRELVQSVFMASKSYRLYNNQIVITPKPTQVFNVFFQYTINDISDILGPQQDVISGFQNIPYSFYKWSYLNQFSKNWIRKYAASCTKQAVGLIRSKFGSLPTAQGDMNLDGSELVNNAMNQKQQLRTQLRQRLQSVSSSRKMSQMRQQADALLQIQKKRPLGIIIG